ncbi:MAG TPA: phosphate signaling complex protein PhoU [Aquabacterium sp.]|nr:phosphate signaling complex protein PhoU [Aquabacterium sp.]
MPPYPDKHLSSQFDSELSALSTRVLEMGGMAESQVAQSVAALVQLDVAAADAVLGHESRLNQLDVEIDRDLSSIIARRQPTARDLRLLIAISKTVSNLERIGDEAVRIARAARRVVGSVEGSGGRLPLSDLSFEAGLATRQLRQALDAFARLDTAAALQVLKADNELDQEFDGLLRKLITYMMEDPRTISAAIDLVFVAKAIERIGDHAKNLAEVVIYVVKGTDVRHNPIESVESLVRR